MSVVISAKDVGIEFYISRRRKMQVRDLLFHGDADHHERHLLGAQGHQLRHPRRRGRRAWSGATAAARAPCSR